MRYQDQLVKMTQKALDDICRSALAVPEDKADWSPAGDARSTLSQMQEIATAAHFFLPLITEGKAPEFTEHAQTQAKNLRQSFDTIGKCIEAAKSSTADLCQAIANVTDQGLEEELTVPFGGGMIMTKADILAIPYWNMVYHLGQINQIQLILGDRAMH